MTGFDEQVIKQNIVSAMDKCREKFPEDDITFISPVEIGRGIDRRYFALGIQFTKPSYGQYMGEDIQYIIDFADTVYFCEGWQGSKGCRLEYEAAKIYDKRIIL
jgi:hypothetical protein